MRSTRDTPHRARDERHRLDSLAQRARAERAVWVADRGAGCRFRYCSWRKSRAGRRIRFGQNRVCPGRSATAVWSAAVWQRALRRPRTRQPERARHARRARQRHRHDFSGADDRAQSAPSGWAADRRGARMARSAAAPRRMGEGGGIAGADGARSAREACGRLPAPALRRAAAAGDDRHGAGLQTAPAAGRRADYRAGCDRAPPDSRPARRAAGRIRTGTAVHHP